MIFILLFCFALAVAAETISPAESNLPCTEPFQNAQRAQNNGDVQAAERYYAQAIQIAEKAGVPAGQLAAAQQLGQLHWKNDNAPAALIYMRMAATLVDRHFPADTLRRGTALNNLAIVLRDAGSSDESEQNHLAALRLFQSINADEKVADTYDGLAELEIGRGNYTRGEEYSKRSLAILEKHGLETMTTGRSLDARAHICQRRPDQRGRATDPSCRGDLPAKPAFRKCRSPAVSRHEGRHPIRAAAFLRSGAAVEVHY